MLTPEQLRTFKQEGAVLLPALVGGTQLSSWRDQAWAAVSASEGRAVDRADSTTWPSGQIKNVPKEMQPKPQLGELPQVRALMAFLGGGAFAGGGHMLKAIFPSPHAGQAPPKQTPNEPHTGDSSSFAGLGTAAVRAHAAANEKKPTASSLPAGDHMDGSGHHRVAITLYLTDVQEDGGCFMYWKGGHRRIHRFWLDHPQHVGEMQPGREAFQDTPPFQDRGWTAIQDLGGTVVPIGTQFAGRAGDALLWHGWTPHSASSCLRHDEPRLALVARWNDAVPLRTAKGERTFHVPQRPEALFEHWGLGVQEGADTLDKTARL